jgi:hypothetical protein
MRTLGSIMEIISPVMTLGTTLGLFISLPTSSTQDNTLVENIFGLSEHQKEKNVK